MSARATATARSKARFRRAAAVLPPITLDQAQADALTAIRQQTGESASAIVRRLIIDESGRCISTATPTN